MADNITLNLGTGGDTLAAKDVDGVKYQKVLADPLDGSSIDAFSRARVSNPTTIFNSYFRYDLLPIRYNAITANSGTITHLPNESSAELATAAVASSSAIMVSKQYHRYIPGKSQLIVMSGVIRAAVANVVKRVGYFDASNGIFLEQNGTTDVAFVRRTSTSGSPVDNRVVQASWNVDPMDGTGPSGITLDLTKSYILVIDLQWLGMGRARVGFDIGGQIVYVHYFQTANTLTSVYMTEGNLPNRWEISGNGVSTMIATCAAVISEGGSELDGGFFMSAGSGLTVRTFTSGTPLPVIAVRPRTTFNGITNHGTYALESVTWLPTSGSNDFLWQLVYDTVITGGSWVNVNTSSSAMEINSTGTAVTGGLVISGGHDNSSNSQRQPQTSVNHDRYPWCVDAVGSQIVMALVMTDISGSSNVHSTMSWREQR